MNGSQGEIAAFLKEISIFRGLGDDDLNKIASIFKVQWVEKGRTIISAGDQDDTFCLIFEGKVHGIQGAGTAREYTFTFVRGDFFGAESLLFRHPQMATISAGENVKLLILDEQSFEQLFSDYPRIKFNLLRISESRHLATQFHFDWLGKDEIIYQIRRKHEAYLALSLIGPFLFGLGALVILFFFSLSTASESAWDIAAAISAILCLIGLGWGIWKWIDWRNDYYIISNQRVVWIEQVIWLYESREEIPLDTILSVNTTRTFIARLLGYGDLVVRTYTGELTLRFIGAPEQLADLIDEYKQRVQRFSRQAESETTQLTIRRRLGYITKEETTQETPASPASAARYLAEPQKTKKDSFWLRNFRNFFKMRFEEGNVITYRKYWTILLGKVWIQSVLILLSISLVSWLGYLFSTGRIQTPGPQFVAIVGLTVLLFLLLWWVYNYVDWRNDIYQVTEKFILDIERKPLGTEVRKSALLENILSLEHRRVGFWGYLLNFGDVTIRVGEAQFIFLGVHDPARVQQDIFKRMNMIRRQKEQTEVSRERDQVVDMLAMYHQSVQEQLQSESFDENEEESGVE